MPRMFPSDRAAKGITVEQRNGRITRYDNDRRDFIHVDNARDARVLKEAGYVQVGNTPASGKFYRCSCGWESWIKHCSRCDSDDLVRVGA